MVSDPLSDEPAGDCAAPEPTSSSDCTPQALRLWSLTRAPGAEHYHFGVYTADGERLTFSLKPQDILEMAAAVLDDRDRDRAQALPAPAH